MVCGEDGGWLWWRVMDGDDSVRKDMDGDWLVVKAAAAAVVTAAAAATTTTITDCFTNVYSYYYSIVSFYYISFICTILRFYCGQCLKYLFC